MSTAFTAYRKVIATVTPHGTAVASKTAASSEGVTPADPVTSGKTTTPDSAISVASQLYTTGGVLDNPCPPALAMQCVHKGRLWAIDETLRTIWFTQTFSSGLAPTWNELMTFPVPDGGDRF